MDVRLNLNGGDSKSRWGTLTLDGGKRHPASPYNLSTGYNKVLSIKGMQDFNVIYNYTVQVQSVFSILSLKANLKNMQSTTLIKYILYNLDVNHSKPSFL